MLLPARFSQALDGVASADRYLQTKDATLTAEANALTTLKANMAVITSAISLGGGYTLPAESKLHKVIYVKTGLYKEVLSNEFRKSCYCW